MPILFDVGANDGSSMFKFTEDPNNIVYAFEPTPRLVQQLKEKAKTRPNYIVIDKAVSNVAGKATFNVAGQADWGCSSLNSFNDNLDKTWPGRQDFKVTEQIEVDVIRLEDFINENQINRIDFLHCDVQGKDLEVLFGLGKHIDIVQGGVIEMPTSHDNKLYKDQQYIAQDAITFLEFHGFEIVQIQPNDVYNNEVNIIYKR